MKKLPVTMAVLLAGSFSFSIDVNAKKPKLEYDQDVTPNTIFGSGNTNGFFTTNRRDGIEVGLRAKTRFPIPDDTDPTISGGDGTYSFPAGDACPGFSFSPTCLTTPLWSFDWSINVNYDGSADQVFSDFVYELAMDADPGPKTNFTVFDNITPSLVAPLFDHAFGNNNTPNDGGTPAENLVTYQNNLDSTDHNVAQNSWNYEFFNNLGTSLEFFDPAIDGNYVICLSVKDPVKGKTLAQSWIQVLVGDTAKAFKGKRNKCPKRRRNQDDSSDDSSDD